MLLDQLKSPWPADFALQPKTAQERLDVIAIQQLKKEAAKEIQHRYIGEKELRKQFETMAISHHFDIDRNPSGEYLNRATFFLWVGYVECAQTNGIIGVIERNGNAI